MGAAGRLLEETLSVYASRLTFIVKHRTDYCAMPYSVVCIVHLVFADAEWYLGVTVPPGIWAM